MKKGLLLGLALLALSGCASIPPPVSLSEDFWNEKDKTVAIVVQQMPQADYMTTGQQGLLDLAINEGANSALNDYLHKLDMAEFLLIGEEFKSLVESRGIAVVSVTTDYELPKLGSFRGGDGGTEVFARNDYRGLREDLAADRLLLISVPSAGVVRPYYGFIPTGEPMASFLVEGKAIDLHTNRVLWRARIDHKLAIKTPWDEPPTFPNVTSAFYKAMEQSRVLLKSDFRVLPAPDSLAAPAAVSSPD